MDDIHLEIKFFLKKKAMMFEYLNILNNRRGHFRGGARNPANI